MTHSSDREYEETGSEGEQHEEIEGDIEEGIDESDSIERVDEEQERGEDTEMIESHQRNHIGMAVIVFTF